MFCPPFGSEVIQRADRSNTRRDVTGSRLLTRFAVMQRAETNIVGLFGATQSGSPPQPFPPLQPSPTTPRTRGNGAFVGAIRLEQLAVA